ncbi:hypothetical protein CDL12_02190 [Handroanthus impetiginosus]|uniref:C2H2-type domain-containing protein n=1 Tax=Handroanthus impetiginosus TaxID=429701 RepID=A0A2G9I5N8_9LAMI|nr:hypothetical protein CDL12_02190 [Handroanthus impetiginosus]
MDLRQLLEQKRKEYPKCEKCSRVFCSPINFRRHLRVHRGSLNVEKLSLEQVKEILAFDDVMLKEIPGSSVLNCLASSLRKPDVSTLPQVYLKAGFSLLEKKVTEQFCGGDADSTVNIIAADTPTSAEASKPSPLPDSSSKEPVLSINLDSPLESLQPQIFMCLCEVKAWIADQNAEALRSQKLLVEEEESEQKRQAVLLESKKQKKLCQDKLEVKEQLYGGNTDLAVIVVADRQTSAKASEPSTSSDSSSNAPNLPKSLDSRLKSLQTQRKESDKDIEAQFGSNREHVNQGDSHTIEPQVALRPSSSRGETSNQISDDKRVVTVGSIPVTLRSHVAQQPPDEALDNCSTESPMLKMKNASEKEIKATTSSHGKIKSIPLVDRGNDSEQDAILEKVHDQILPGERSTVSQPTDDEDFDNRENYRALSDENAEHEGCPHYREDCHVPSDEYAQREFCPYCIAATREFLAKRWEAAISGEHEILDLS